jgi:hypothetical protein
MRAVPRGGKNESKSAVVVMKNTRSLISEKN